MGFHLVGIAPAVRLPEADMYRQWLEKGFAGEMSYMTRHKEKRQDCRILFPPARSVIVCGLSYHSSITTSLQDLPSSKGWISRYAWGDDYHIVVKQKLFALVEFIQQETNIPIEAKVCVDTVPLLERLYGRYAGLGWIGKHGGLINQQYGSWFFLGEILLNLDLEYDSPIPDRCGTCTRCLDACPTGALVLPRILDARKCISYLTIEYRNSVPEKFRPFIGNCIFGCDRCQEVCPWNQKAEAPEYPEFLPRKNLYQPDLTWLLMITQKLFSHLFRHSPIKRSKLAGVLRNTVIVIGNSQDPAFIPLLEQIYDTVDPLVQTHIAWAIQRLTCSSEKPEGLRQPENPP